MGVENVFVDIALVITFIVTNFGLFHGVEMVPNFLWGKAERVNDFETSFRRI